MKSQIREVGQEKIWFQNQPVAILTELQEIQSQYRDCTNIRVCMHVWVLKSHKIIFSPLLLPLLLSPFTTQKLELTPCGFLLPSPTLKSKQQVTNEQRANKMNSHEPISREIGSLPCQGLIKPNAHRSLSSKQGAVGCMHPSASRKQLTVLELKESK